MATIGERLRLARNRKVWTQWDLARESGVPVVTISRIENGRQENQPRQSTIRRLATPLGIDPAWLLFGDEEDGQGKAAGGVSTEAHRWEVSHARE